MHRRGFRGLLPGNDPNLSEKILIQKWEIVSFFPLGERSGAERSNGIVAAGKEGSSDCQVLIDYVN